MMAAPLVPQVLPVPSIRLTTSAAPAISATLQTGILHRPVAHTYSAELQTIPTKLPAQQSKPIEVARVAGSKPLQFGVRLQGTVSKLQLRIIAPDGRVAEYPTGGKP